MEKLQHNPTGKGPAACFTGDVYVDGIYSGQDPSQMTMAHVRFTPCARTNWHSHEVGQLLVCTGGTGLVATRDGNTAVLRPGESVWTPPGEEHWHGATEKNLMSHFALLEKGKQDDPTTWLEPVSDEEYQRAHQAAGAALEGRA